MVVSLALGIGANAAVFSAVNTFVLKPLPVGQPEHLLAVQGRPGLSFPDYRDLRDRNSSLTALAGYRMAPMNLEIAAGPVRTWGYLATGNHFDALGVEPAVGRFFHAGDERGEGDVPFVVLSHDCWTARFGGDPGVVGRVLHINRFPFTVLGVAPKAFRGTELFYRPDVWVPMMMEPQIEVGHPWLENRRTWNTLVLARLKPGVTPAAAAADLNRVASELAREYPRANDGFRLQLSRPGFLGDVLGGPVRAFTVGVLALAGLVLLAGCANLASVLAARGADRQRELAVRISIDASRGRVVRQLLTETVLLAGAGGAAGCALAALVRGLPGVAARPARVRRRSRTRRRARRCIVLGTGATGDGGRADHGATPGLIRRSRRGGARGPRALRAAASPRGESVRRTAGNTPAGRHSLGRLAATTPGRSPDPHGRTATD
jgi:predicted permease